MPQYFEKIPLLNRASYITREFTVDKIDFPSHYHHEYELIYIPEGNGQRFVGDHLADFRQGDLVLLGPDLPHHYIASEGNAKNVLVRLVITQFHPDFLGAEFAQRLEAVEINQLLHRSSHGVRFFGSEASIAGRMLERILRTKDRFKGLLILLHVLHLLASSRNWELLSVKAFNKSIHTGSVERIEAVYDFLAQKFKDDITLNELAGKFYMSVSAMSHFLKKKTGKNFTELLLELRINYACELLIRTDRQVFEICYESGFNNLSYFNRVFKAFRNTTPLKFRKFPGHSAW